MKYQYKDPLENGYTKIKVSKALHNSVFKYRQRTLCKDLFTKYEYCADDWSIRVEALPTLFTKSLSVLFFPLFVLYYGVGNFGELKDELYRVLNPKETGSFCVDDITGEKYKEVMKAAMLTE